MFELLKLYLDTAVFSVLGLMSLIALAKGVERWLTFRSVRVQDYGQLEQLRLDLSRGVAVIATIAANAPYVGLLGTVFGIMITFNDIGVSGQIDTNSIMAGLAMALKATALGLFVAIPSMVIYNLLSARAEELLSQWKIVHERET